LVFWADLGHDGNVTHKEVSSGRGVEVKVEPSSWWVEASSGEFVDGVGA
jgi:hypothetical protein